MYVIGPRVVALAAPVVVNAFGVAAMLALLLDLPYWASAVWVGIGEAAVLFTPGPRAAPRGAQAPRAVRLHTTGRLTRPQPPPAARRKT